MITVEDARGLAKIGTALQFNTVLNETSEIIRQAAIEGKSFITLARSPWNSVTTLSLNLYKELNLLGFRVEWHKTHSSSEGYTYISW